VAGGGASQVVSEVVKSSRKQFRTSHELQIIATMVRRLPPTNVMRNRSAVAAIAAATVLSLASPVHAETSPDDWGGAAVGIPIFLGLELTPLVLGTVDVVARPQSRTYAGVEVAVGGVAVALNTFLAIDFATEDNCSDCGSLAPVFVGLALIDAAVVAHGAYLLLRDEPAQVSLGSARGHVSPTVVSDGKDHGAGLGVVGHF
jgi:hypothetical protein